MAYVTLDGPVRLRCAMSGHPVDVHVGARLKLRRKLLGKSQTWLGDAARITFQQVQKYEKGSNRCSASMLVTFADALDVAPAYFFEGLPARKATP